MSVESASFINQLNESNPTSSDLKSEGDNHIRLLKSTIKTTFPNVTGAVTPTHTQLNYVFGVTSPIQDQLNRSLRQSGGSAVNVLPNAASRALKVLSFDIDGHPRTTIAETDLTTAIASASDAAASAAAAAASLDSFDDRYLGAKASAPSVDNDGNALIVGAKYFNTTESKMYVRNASNAWQLDTADSGSVNYLPAGTGAVATTAQSKLRESVSVKDFGAVGNGVANDTTSIQNAINAVSASGGGIVFFPPGVYQTTGVNLLSGVILQGAGEWATVLRTTSATAVLVTMDHSTAVNGIKFKSSVTRTAGWFVGVVGNGVTISRCTFEDYFIAVSSGVVGGVQTINNLVTDCTFRCDSTLVGSGGVQFLNFSNAAVKNCVMSGPALPSIQPTFGVRFRNGDTAFVTDTNITLHGRALFVDPDAVSNCYALTITGSLFDSAGSDASGTVNSAEISAAGGVYNTRISNTWFGLSESKSGCSVGTSGSGVVDGITFTGCEFTDNADCGLIAVGANVKNLIVTGGHSGGNTNSGVRMASGISSFTITGHVAGNIAGRGANNVGITVDSSSSDNYTIQCCNVVGNTSSGISDAGTGSNATVINNIGFNGLTAVAGLSVGASPWTYTAGHTPEIHYFAGGTLSEIRVDGQIVQNTTAATIQLVPNQVMQVTYTVAPTIMRKRA